MRSQPSVRAAVAAGGDVPVRALEEVQDLREQDEHDHRADADRDRADEDAVAQLDQMLDQRHLAVCGCRPSSAIGSVPAS